MQAKVYWTKEKYPGRIAIVPRPRGGEWLEDEAAAWGDANLDVIVSLLEADENEAFELAREAEFCEANNISFFSFPIADRRVPVSKNELLKLLNKLKMLLGKGKNIGIHCRQSIGRSALMAAALMVLFGISPDNAFQQLSEIRGLEVPETDGQRNWIEKFAEELAMQSA
ncbi:MAG: hypothetical protein LH614_15780 [Pyrinomonadaceae bacterium]|nr:hypothetical protein [Pyrinomonadaceae bacterium]